MPDLLKMIAQTAPSETQTDPLTSEAFWDPASIVICTAGVCILIAWMVWFEGFKALRKSPVRRHRKQLFVWPLIILALWIAWMVVAHNVIQLLFGSLSTPVQEAITYVLNASIEMILILLVLIIAGHLFSRGIKGFGFNLTTLTKDAALAPVNLAAVFPVIYCGLLLTLLVGRFFAGEDFNLEVHQSLDILTEAGPELKIIIFIFAVIVVPVFEELLFRGLFQTTVRSLTQNPWIAIVSTSAFFAVLHPPTHIAALFALSCGLGYAYERSGSLLRPILMHMLFNGTNVTVTLFLAS